ncbi:zinc ribbon domain-containing protein [Elusimicrobiota bacterium]
MKILMNENIRILLELQKLDGIDDNITSRLNEIPMLIEEEDRKAKECDDELMKSKEAVQSINMQIKQKEMDLGSAEEFVRKQSQQLNTLKSNEAYSKMQTEIASKKESVGKIEEEILELEYKLEESQEQSKKLQEDIEARKIQIKQVQETYRDEIKTLTENKRELEEKIKPIELKVNASILRNYRKVRERRDGIAVIKIEGSSCGGCHWQLPPQVINEVLKGNDIISCDNCSRLLYVSLDEDD